jgi:hypothetical protein
MQRCSWPSLYVWLLEDLYNKEYVDTHVVGMDKFAAYVLGNEDGVPKTPAWASKKCGVPEWTIKALAREYAAKVTSVAHYFGGGLCGAPIPMNTADWKSFCWACRDWAARECTITS